MGTRTRALNPENDRSDLFRTVFADTVGVQFTGAQCVLTFGIAHNPADAQKGMEEQVAIAMTPLTMKNVGFTLSTLIEHFERATSTVIPLDPNFKELLDNALKTAIKKSPA